MKIAIVSRIYRPEPAAASFFLGAVADALTSQEQRVTVVTVSPPPGLKIPQNTAEKILTFPVLRDKTGYVKGYLQYLSYDLPLLVRLLLLPRPDVVFVEPPPTTGAVVRLVCALRKIPYVYDAADIWSDAAAAVTSQKLVLKTLRALEKFALNGASRLVTISSGVAERINELGVTTPVTVTGFGADTASFTYQPTPLRKEFIYAGTFSHLHGAKVLVSAFAQLAQRYPDYRLRFIGNGDEKARLQEQAAQLGIAERVSFEPPMPAHLLSVELNQATGAVATQLPDSNYQYAFTSKIYSAMAAGCPVVFAGPGPTGDFIRAHADQEIGYANAYDATALAHNLEKLITQPKTAAERALLAAWTKQEHSLQAVAARIAQSLTTLKDA